MVELITNDIGPNEISEKIGKIDPIEAKIKETYKEIYETKDELKGLKDSIMTNLSGKQFKDILADELTVEHVKEVLNQAIAKMSAKPWVEGFNQVYADMGAGLVFNLQLGLAKLGFHFTWGIDGMYGRKDTNPRVEEFQRTWNAQHPADRIGVDGWAGQATLTKMVAALNDPNWDKSKILTIADKKQQTVTKKNPVQDKRLTTDPTEWRDNNRTDAPTSVDATKQQVETQVAKTITIPRTWLRSGDVVISLTPNNNGRFPYTYESTNVKETWSYSQEQIWNLLTDAYLEDKEFSINDIFAKEDFSGANATQINKLKDNFNANGSISLDDVKVIEENGKKYVRVDYDNRGMDADRAKNRRFDYDDVFTAEGTLNRNRFLAKMREDIIANVLPHLPY